MELCSSHLPGDQFSGQLGVGVPGGRLRALSGSGLGAEQVRP